MVFFLKNKIKNSLYLNPIIGAAQAAGACWYLLGIQRSAKCLKEQCRGVGGCDLRLLACKDPIYYGTSNMVRDRARLAWAENKQARSTCIDSPDNYD